MLSDDLSSWLVLEPPENGRLTCPYLESQQNNLVRQLKTLNLVFRPGV